MSGSIFKAIEPVGSSMDPMSDVEDVSTIEVVLEQDLDAIVEEAMENVGRALPHDANLVVALDDDVLTRLGQDVCDYYEADERSRLDWKNQYFENLKLLGLKDEPKQEPWPNACNVVHPMITEAVIRFQSNTIMEMFPISGPYKATIHGPETEELAKVAERLKIEMNHVATQIMPEYRTEVEQGLWQLGVSGMGFRKVWMDPFKRRPVAETISAHDIVVPYSASHIFSSPRVTQVMKLHKDQVDQYIASGWWFEVDLPPPAMEYSERENEEGELQGITPTMEYDDRYTFLEMQLDLDLPGFEFEDHNLVKTGLKLPYVVTVEKSSRKVMAIRRNWMENDQAFSRKNNIFAMCYIPGWGFYGIGLLALMAGLARGATSTLRQLVDKGTISNLPAGFKGKGFRTRNDSGPLRPGEFRDVEMYAGRISDNIMQIQFGEPSPTLAALMGTMVEEGRRLGAIAELPTKTGEMPVGTIIAMIEHQTKPQSAVQARIYASFASELKMIYDMLKAKGHKYTAPGLENFDFNQDCKAPISMVPVADPGASSSAVRILQAQAAVELANSNPQMYDKPAVHRMMLRSIGVGDVDAMLPNKDNVIPGDPITENMNLMVGKPVKAGIDQDHKAHIRAHMAMMQDPRMAMIIGQSPNAAQTQAAIMAHLAEHAAFLHRDEVLQNLGFPVPMGPLPAIIEQRIAPLVADAAFRAAQAGQAKQQQEQQQQAEQDPIAQLQKADIALRKDKLEKDFLIDWTKLQLQAKKDGASMANEAMKVGNQQRQIGAQIVEKYLQGRM